MNIDVNELLEQISDDDLSAAAAGLEITVEEMKAKYRDAISELQEIQNVKVELGQQSIDEECQTHPFELKIEGLINIYGHTKFCVNGPCYLAEVQFCISLIGLPRVCRTVTLDCNTAEFCLSTDAGFANAKICLGIRGARECFYIKGEACYWAGVWKCTSFDETLICFAPTVPTLNVESPA